MNNNVRDKIITWLFDGDVGCSSKAMAGAMIGVGDEMMTPSDPADLNRCLMLLEAVPEIRENMDKVAAISDQWKALVVHWEEIEKCFLDEVGFNWSKGGLATQTYELMASFRV